jgi:hypothetical protein
VETDGGIESSELHWDGSPETAGFGSTDRLTGELERSFFAQNQAANTASMGFCTLQLERSFFAQN